MTLSQKETNSNLVHVIGNFNPTQNCLQIYLDRLRYQTQVLLELLDLLLAR